MDLKDKNVLVTGSSGFIGRELCKTLEIKGSNLFFFDRSHKKDVTKEEDFDNFGRIDLVYHLASILNSHLTEENISTLYRVNNGGTSNVLEFCKKKNAKLVHVSSYIYGDPKYLPVDEKHPINPKNDYSLSKYLAETKCTEYHNNLKLPLIIVRPFNIYGPYQKEDFLVPTILKQINQGKNVEVNDLRPKRDFLYIDDFISALIKLGEYDKPFDIFNVGSGMSYSVEEIAKTMIRISGKQLKVISRNKVRQNDVLDCYADLSKITSHIGWKPCVSLEEGLERILKS